MIIIVIIVIIEIIEIIEIINIIPFLGLDFLRAQQMAAGLPPGHVDPHLLHLHRAYAEAAAQQAQAAAGIRLPHGVPPGMPPGTNFNVKKSEIMHNVILLLKLAH